MSRSGAAITLIVLSGVSCHHQSQSPGPTTATEQHCWWAVMRSALPLESVAVRFAGAFSSAGLTSVSIKRVGDSVWIHGGPTALAQFAGNVFDTRVVGYWDGSNTHFRQFVSELPSTSASVGQAHQTIPFCGASLEAANVQAIVPKEPTGEESLKLWTRVP